METINLKTCLNLSKYLIAEDGSVIESDEVLEYPKHKGLALQTDEDMTLPLTKKKIKLVRRFTRDDILKLYNSKHSEPFNADAPVKSKRSNKANKNAAT